MRKNQRFPEAVHFMNHASLDNWNAILNILLKRFFQLSGKNFCINRIKIWFFHKKWSFHEKFPLKTSEVFLTNLAESFLVAFPKKFCNKTFFQNKCFSSESSPSIKLEILATLLKLFAKSQKQIAQNPLIWGKFYFFKKFVFHQMFLWTIKMHFCHLCCNFFSENLKNLRLKAEELEKYPFFTENVFHEDVAMGT